MKFEGAGVEVPPSSPGPASKRARPYAALDPGYVAPAGRVAVLFRAHVLRDGRDSIGPHRPPGRHSVSAVLHSRFVEAPRRALATVGRSADLAASVLRYVVVDAVRLRLPIYEIVNQMWSLLKVTALPALLMAVPIGAEVAVQVGGIMDQVGANSLAGAASGLGVVGQGAPMAAGLLLSGAAASAIASDLGSRAIREEIDAMRVMGVDPVERLIMPRFIAMVAIAPILCIIIVSAGVAAGLLIASNVSGVVPGSFWQSFGAFATTTDLTFSVIKALIFATIVVLIASLRGLEAKGGPKGVANAVNASVVLSVFFIFMTNLLVSQLQTMFFPARLA